MEANLRMVENALILRRKGEYICIRAPLPREDTRICRAPHRIYESQSGCDSDVA